MGGFAQKQRGFLKKLRLYLKTSAPPEQVLEAYREMRISGESLPVQQSTIHISHSVADIAIKHPAPQYELLVALRAFIEKYLSDDITTFLVHGSFATADFVDGWSDLDTLVIVRDEVFQSVERLERFKKYFSRAAFVCYQIDPLAHHELVAVSVYDIAHYPQTLFPMPVFQNAAVLTGAADVPFALRDDAAERMLVLREFRSRFMEKVSKNTYSTTAIDWKNDLACALLLPALALQAKGEFVYKRESFTLAKERFPDLDWSCIDEASAIRRDWRAHSLMQRTPVLWVLQGLIPRSLFKKLLFPVCHRQPRQSPEDIARLTRAFLELSDAILEMA